jgi:hypothetical protein
MTTRQLEEPRRYDAPTQLTNSAPTAPAYMPPQWAQQSDAMPPQWVQPTAGMQSGGQKKMVIILASVIGVLLITLGALIFVMMNKTPVPSSRSTIRIGPPPPGSEMPPPPPPPGIPGSAPTTLAKELIYPGATVTMSVPGGEGKGVTNLTVHDSFDKVMDWYLARVKPVKRVMLPGPSAMLKGDGIMVMITGASNEINILITQGHED